jgi:hypothetical protein
MCWLSERLGGQVGANSGQVGLWPIKGLMRLSYSEQALVSGGGEPVLVSLLQ